MKYRLAKQSGIPYTTLSDLCKGKTRIEKCSSETLYKIAKALNVTMEAIMEEGTEKKEEKEIEEATERERATNTDFRNICSMI